ncbi:MAG: ABC transporter substrate-binding protein [Aristaeellaceae bacterium]
MTLSVGVLAEGHYPVTISNYDGYIESNKGAVVEQTFESCPERIVSISQANTELLIMLGLGDRIVATAHRRSPVYEPVAEEYNALVQLTDDNEYPSKEVVVEADPDIIVGWGSLFEGEYLGSVVEWHEKGIHTYVMNNTVPGLGDRKVSWILDDIEKLGKIFDVEDRANELIDEIQTRLDAVAARTADIPEEERPRVATVQFMYENEYGGRASTDLTADIITLSGGISLDDAGGRMSLETLIELNPDIILVVNQFTSPAEDTIAAMKANESLQRVEAVKNDRFLVIEHAAFYCGGMRTIEAIEALSDIMANM